MRIFIAGLAALALAPAALAESVYKWVDEDGVVTYSTIRPDGSDSAVVDEVKVQRELTPEEEAQAAARRAALMEQSTSIGDDITAKDKEKVGRVTQVQEAREAVRRAERGLYAAKMSKKQYSDERVKMNESSLAEARKRLKSAEAGTLRLDDGKPEVVNIGS